MLSAKHYALNKCRRVCRVIFNQRSRCFGISRTRRNKSSNIVDSSHVDTMDEKLRSRQEGESEPRIPIIYIGGERNCGGTEKKRENGGRKKYTLQTKRMTRSSANSRVSSREIRRLRKHAHESSRFYSLYLSSAFLRLFGWSHLSNSAKLNEEF